MERLDFPHQRAERLIAAGRVALSLASLFAIWFDPTEPVERARIAYALLFLYVAYSTAIATIVFRADSTSPLQRAVTHVFDFIYFSVFIYFTTGPASPFTAYFIFSMVCATLRWRWRVALWTAVAVLSTYAVLGVVFSEVLHDPTFHATRFILRGTYLTAIGALLAYLGAHEQRTRREMAALAAWPHAVPSTLSETLVDLLTQTARTFEAPRAALAWCEPEEPWLYLAHWSERGFSLEREPPDRFEPLVDGALAERSFLCAELHGRDSSVLARTDQGFERLRALPLHPDLAERFASRSILSLLLRGEWFEGRLFVLDPPDPSSDELSLGIVVAERVGARLDHFYLAERLRQSAATEERIRVARDLHDGVLQSFTGIALRLESMRRQLASGAPGAEVAEGALSALMRQVATDQRDLRLFIRELGPGAIAERAPAFDLSTRLADLAERLALEWGVAIELETTAAVETVETNADLEPASPPSLAPEIAREVYLLAREALINALRHGEASAIRLRVDARDRGSISVTVVDNGRGFPFEGRFSGPELAARDLGPRSLRERIAALAGTLELESSPRGSVVDMRLPRKDAA